MAHGMCHFMDGCFHGLLLAHAIPDYDIFIHIAVIPFSIPFNLCIAHRGRGHHPDRLHENVKVLHTPHQFRRIQLRERITLRLRNVKYRRYTEPWDDMLHFLRFRLSVRAQHWLVCLRVKFLHFFLFPDRHRGNNLDPLLPTLHLTVKFFVPCAVACHQG